MRQVWSTADVNPRDRVAYWVDAICGSIHIESAPRRSAPFFGAFSIEAVGNVLLTNVASVAQTVVHPARYVGRDEPHFCFITQTSGRSRISQDGRDAVLDPGDLAMIESTRPFEFEFDGEFAQSVVRIPRELLFGRIGPAEQLTAHRIDGRKGFGSLLSPMLQNLDRQLHDVHAGIRARFGENLLDLVATALLSESGETRIPAEMTRVRVKLWIETHLTEDLSGRRIAVANGVSVRHLNRLFAGEGTSLMHYVWDRRLTRCRRDLTDPAMAHRPIGEIALAAGFKDLSHFSRAYRARYGRTAREDRLSPERGS
jgi:AraC-like DNA-binding protein